MNAAEIHVPDEPLPLTALVKHFDHAPVLEHGDARLGRRRIDQELLPQAFANRRYSTARMRPMPRKDVATEEPP